MAFCDDSGNNGNVDDEFDAVAVTVDGGDEFCLIDVDVTVAFVFAAKWASGVAGCLGLRFSVDDELRLWRCDFSGAGAEAPVDKSKVLESQSLAPELEPRDFFGGGTLFSNGPGEHGFGVAGAAIISWSPFTSVSPRICNISATRNNGPIWAWLTLISPLYMNSTIAFNSVHLTSRIITIGCWHGLSKNSVWKYGLQAESTILWALMELPSQASVTSTNDSFCSNWSKTLVKFRW